MKISDILKIQKFCKCIGSIVAQMYAFQIYICMYIWIIFRKLRKRRQLVSELTKKKAKKNLFEIKNEKKLHENEN